MIEVLYDQAVANPKAAAAEVNAFFGGKLDEAKMVEAIDGELYRNRKGKTV